MQSLTLLENKLKELYKTATPIVEEYKEKYGKSQPEQSVFDVGFDGEEPTEQYLHYQKLLEYRTRIKDVKGEIEDFKKVSNWLWSKEHSISL